VLNKIKKLFMKKEKIGEMRIPADELQKEYEALEQEGAEITPIPEGVVTKQEQLDETINEESLLEFQPTAEQLKEMKNVGYLDNSSSVVGYGNRQEQYAAYAEIVPIIPQNSSILDFGCGRGDFFAWHEMTYGKGNLDYLGIDANQALIDSGRKMYDGINLRCNDWTLLKKKFKKDWCINIRSNNLRYDSQTEMSDEEYAQQTIEKMYEMCNEGLVITLSSDKFDVPGQKTYNAGNIMSWAVTKYDMVAVDHTCDTNQFLVIIYKTNKDGKSK
jgi:SAM-dependent methyltransferase